MNKSSLLIPFALLFMSAPALAIYKCEVAGKTVYSDLPCADSVHRTQEIRVAPNDRDATDAQQRLQQDKEELQRLQNARRKQEASDDKARQRARKAHQSREKKCAQLALRAKWAKEDTERAAGKSLEKARRTARRAEENYRLSCDGQS